MRFKFIFLCFMITLPAAAGAQAPLEAISSVPIPAEVSADRGWAEAMVGCGADETITIYLQRPHQLVKFGLNGAVLVRIDAMHMAGPGEGQVESFAPGPHGEIYVMGTHVTLIERKDPDPSKPSRVSRRLDAHPTLLIFDANGALIKSRAIPGFVMPWIAVFDSGDFLLVDGEWEKSPIAWIYSADGNPLKRIDLSTTALGGHASDGPNEVSVFAAGDKAFLLAQWYEPKDKVQAAIATITRDGEVASSTVVKLPPGYNLRDPRRMGEHLFGSLQIQANGDPKLGEPYVAVDPQSGHVRKYDREPNRRFPACDTAQGMSFFNVVDQTLEVIQLKAQSNP
jgi:hypothetical protein